MTAPPMRVKTAPYRPGRRHHLSPMVMRRAGIYPSARARLRQILKMLARPRQTIKEKLPAGIQFRSPGKSGEDPPRPSRRTWSVRMLATPSVYACCDACRSPLLLALEGVTAPCRRISRAMHHICLLGYFLWRGSANVCDWHAEILEQLQSNAVLTILRRTDGLCNNSTTAVGGFAELTCLVDVPLCPRSLWFVRMPKPAEDSSTAAVEAEVEGYRTQVQLLNESLTIKRVRGIGR